MSTATIDDFRAVLLTSRKFLEWRPRVRHHDGRSRSFGETVKNSSEPASFKSIVDEPHYSPAELAKSWGVSIETIRSIFRDEPDVFKIKRAATRTKRGYLTLRIPQSVAERVHRRMAA
jgi:hypothetical protein